MFILTEKIAPPPRQQIFNDNVVRTPPLQGRRKMNAG
jgi:hypothetical protein